MVEFHLHGLARISILNAHFLAMKQTLCSLMVQACNQRYAQSHQAVKKYRWDRAKKVAACRDFATRETSLTALSAREVCP
jgi:hypothetical protein